MDTFNLIQKILYAVSENAWIIYVLVFFKFKMTAHAPSVETIWRIDVLSKFTKYGLLPILSLFGFFQLTKWGNFDWLLIIAIDMILVMINIYFIRLQLSLNYKYLKGRVVELYVLQATDESLRYMLIDDDGRVVWDELTSSRILINTLQADAGDTFFARIADVKPGKENMFQIEILQDEEFDAELKRREEMKKRLDNK